MIAGNVVRLLGLVVLNGLSVWLVLDGNVWAFFFLHLGVVGGLLWGTLTPQSKLFGPIQTHVESDGIWLTFDDGPDPEGTPMILDVLKARGVKATFFVVGEKASSHPRLIHRLLAEGHQIGNHTWSHPQATIWCAGPWRTYREIMCCQEVVKKITGEAPDVFRAPVGHSNFFMHAVLRKFGLRLIGWNSRGYDGVSKNVDEVMGRIRASMKPGGIVLAHENSPIALEVSVAILDHAEANGWAFIDPKESR